MRRRKGSGSSSEEEKENLSTRKLNKIPDSIPTTFITRTLKKKSFQTPNATKAFSLKSSSDASAAYPVSIFKDAFLVSN